MLASFLFPRSLSVRDKLMTVDVVVARMVVIVIVVVMLVAVTVGGVVREMTKGELACGD